jgi:hypothetical protein
MREDDQLSLSGGSRGRRPEARAAVNRVAGPLQQLVRRALLNPK